MTKKQLLEFIKDVPDDEEILICDLQARFNYITKTNELYPQLFNIVGKADSIKIKARGYVLLIKERV